MRIAVWHNLPSGGGKRALVDHVDGLLARGHEVEVWTNPLSAAEPPHFSGSPVQHLVPLDIDPGERGGALPPWPVVRRRLHAMSRHLDSVASGIEAGGFDVLLGGSCRYLRTVDLASRVAIPAVLYAGEPYRWLYEAMPTLPWALPTRERGERFGRWTRRRLRDAATVPGLRRQVAAEVAAARGWDRILVNSAYSRDSIRRVYGVAAQVCYLGIDTTRLEHASRPRDRVVLGLGAMVPEKGVERAVRAVAAMSAPQPILRWVANVESTPFRQTVEVLCKELGVILDLHVAVADKGLAEILAESAVLIYTPYLEPFGLAALEASAAGLPVVGVAEGGIRETVVDGINGILVWDDADLPAALDRVISDPELSARLSAGGRTLVADRWTIEAAVGRLEAQLCQVVGGLS
jgi:glycosyltransferase involved in cell wall biosynthesis